MDAATRKLQDLISEACGLLSRCETAGGHDLRLLTQLDLLRFELLAQADAALDAACIRDACDVVTQINAVLQAFRSRGAAVAQAS